MNEAWLGLPLAQVLPLAEAAWGVTPAVQRTLSPRVKEMTGEERVIAVREERKTLVTGLFPALYPVDEQS